MSNQIEKTPLGDLDTQKFHGEDKWPRLNIIAGIRGWVRRFLFSHPAGFELATSRT